MIRQGRYISLIKAASRGSVPMLGGEMLGKLITKGTQATRAANHALGEVGAGVAKATGKNQETGRRIGKAVLPTAAVGGTTVTVAESDKGKRLRAQQGILVPEEYGGMF